jgi:hypothetical protein
VSTVPEDISEDQKDDTQTSSQTDTPPVVEEDSPAKFSEQPEDNFNNLSKKVDEQEQQIMQFQQQNQLSQVQAQTAQYEQQLEQQGYLPEQAKQISQAWMSQQSQMSQLQQQQEQQIKFVQGQAAAAEHFANQYKLQLSDLAKLRSYPNPDSMESAAKEMASDRKKDARIAELEAQLVPKQTFDDSQSTPAASNDENRWLERYNQGDTSPQAQAAARRAAGLA